MAKVRDLRNFAKQSKTIQKKSNRKSDDKGPPFLSSASDSVNQSSISRHERKFQHY